MSDSNAPDRLGTALEESWAGRAGSAVVAAAASAWPSSTLRQLTMPLASGWSSLDPAQRIRAVALAVVVAMLVERAMTWLMRRPTDPLSAVLPVTVLVTSVAIGAFAGRLAGVCERLHR